MATELDHQQLIAIMAAIIISQAPEGATFEGAVTDARALWDAVIESSLHPEAQKEPPPK